MNEQQPSRPPIVPPEEKKHDPHYAQPSTRGQTTSFQAMDDAAYVETGDPTEQKTSTPVENDQAPAPGRAYFDKAPFTPYPADQQQKDPDGELLMFPGDTFKNNQAAYEANSRAPKKIVTAGDIAYADVMYYGQQTGHDDELDEAVNRENGDWRNRIETENGPIRAGRPKLSDSHAKILAGDAAVQRVRMIAGIGSALSIPLPHTGIWVRMGAPSKDALINLHYQIAMEKTRLGRKTFGLVFSNETIYRTGAVVDLALNCIEEHTLATGIELKDVIKHHDIPILIWGLACLAYPRGFDYARAVRSDDESKRRIVRGIVDISKMLVFDNSYLSDFQKKHLSRRFGATTTLEDLKKYQDEFMAKKTRVELIPGQLWMSLKVPNLGESLNSGQRWVDSIETLVKQTLGVEASDAQRNRLISVHATATTMRQFTQWVEKIEDENHIYEEVETIEKMLDDLSELPDIRDRYIGGIRTFINDTTAAIIACPVVDAEEAAYVQPQYPKYPWMIPIDPSIVFFQLLAQRIAILETITNYMEQISS